MMFVVGVVVYGVGVGTESLTLAQVGCMVLVLLLAGCTLLLGILMTVDVLREADDNSRKTKAVPVVVVKGSPPDDVTGFMNP